VYNVAFIKGIAVMKINLVLAGLVVLFSGCVSTSQVVPNPTSPIPEKGKSRIVLKGIPLLADMAVDVFDNDVLIGTLTSSGRLTWDRPMGKMELSGFAKNVLPPQSEWSIKPMTLYVGGSRTYQIRIDGSGYGFRLVHGEPLKVDPAIIPDQPTYDSLALSSDALSLPKPHWSLENIAVSDLNSETLDDEETRTISDKLRSTIVNTSYFNVVSRTDMLLILAEQNFQKAGYVDKSETLVEMGRILAVKKMVGGAVGKIGNTYLISIQLLDVETGEIELRAEETFAGDKEKLLLFVELAGRDLARGYAREKSK